MASGAAHFPDPLIGLLPGGFQEVKKGLAHPPGVVERSEAVTMCLVEGVSDLPIDVELELPGGGVANPPRASILRSPRASPVSARSAGARLQGHT